MKKIKIVFSVIWLLIVAATVSEWISTGSEWWQAVIAAVVYTAIVCVVYAVYGDFIQSRKSV